MEMGAPSNAQQVKIPDSSQEANENDDVIDAEALKTHDPCNKGMITRRKSRNQDFLRFAP